MNDAVAVLERALYLMEEVGWTKDTGVREDGSTCSVGAVYLAATVLGADADTVLEANYFLDVALRHRADIEDHKCVVDWQDDKERSFEEVRSLFNNGIRLGKLAAKGIEIS